MNAGTSLPLILDVFLSVVVLVSVISGVRAARRTESKADWAATGWVLLLIGLALVYGLGLYVHHAIANPLAREILSPLRVAVVPFAMLLVSRCAARRAPGEVPAPMLSRGSREMLRRFWQGIVVTLPVWFVVLAVILYGLGYLLDERVAKEAKIQKVIFNVAAAVMSGGVFAAILKAMQFIGVFQDAVENIILAKRDWLSQLSETKIRSLFHDLVATIVTKGFPNLSERVTNDVLFNILPKLEKYYYSRMYRRIELVSYDPERDALEMIEHYELIIHAHSHSQVPYKFEFNGLWPNSSEKCPYEVTSLIVDGRDQTDKVERTGNKGEKIRVKYSVPLDGKEEYEVRRNLRRHVIVSADPVMHMVGKHFTESMVVTVDNRVGDAIHVEAMPIGMNGRLLEITRPEPHLLRCDVRQLMLPNDGLLLIFEKRLG